MDLGLSLDWTRCPDGVEIFERELAHIEVHSLAVGRGLDPAQATFPATAKFVRFKSDAREVLHFDSRNYRDSIVMKFASANTEEGLQRFLSDYGLPEFGKPALNLPDAVAPPAALLKYWDSLPEGTLLETIQWRQAEIRKLVQSPASFADQFAASMQMRMLPPKNGQQHGLLLEPDTLVEFMKIEAALIVCGHAEVTTCSHCGGLYVMGGEKAKRTDSKYCSSNCRLKAYRKRKKAASKKPRKRRKK